MLEILAKHHKEWLSIVKNFGAKYPEDVIQDFYIVASQTEVNKIIQNKEPNRAYIWITLRNMTFKEKVTNFEELPINLSSEDEPYDFKKDELIDKTIEVIETFNDYEKRLFEIHVNSEISGNKLAKATGINKYSIYRTLRKCKQKIKDEVNEK